MSASPGRSVPSWLLGVTAVTAVLTIFEIRATGFFASFGGLLIVGGVALMVGVATASIADRDHAARNAAVVAFYVLLLAAVYFLWLPAIGEPGVPGSRGGPGVYPPPDRGGPPIPTHRP
jgi:hypothetical protein